MNERQLRGFGLTVALYPRKVVRGRQVLQKSRPLEFAAASTGSA
jgi:hypothetical protein